MGQNTNKGSKKLCIIGTRGYPSTYGGFETAIRKIAPYLAANEFEVTVYSRKGCISPELIQPKSQVKTVFTPYLSSKSLSTLTHGFSSSVHAIVSRQKIALLMNVANGYWLPFLKIFGVKTIVNVDGLEWQRDKWNWLGKRIFWGGAWLTSKFADRLVFDAIAIADYWKLNFGSENGVFIPYGSTDYRKHEIAQEGKKEQYVLFLARLVPENSIHEFLQSVNEICTFANVVIVGSDGAGEKFSKMIEEVNQNLPQLKFWGHISDQDKLFEVWSHATIYFHGHTVGGTNPALVQAMSLGIPTVAVDTVFNREVLGGAGKFVSRDSQSITQGLRELFLNEEERFRFAQLAAKRAQEFYNWESVCQSYLLELRNLRT